MLPFRRNYLRAAAISALAYVLAGCSDTPTALPQFSTPFTLVTVDGQPTPFTLANQHVEVLFGGLTVAADGTGNLTYGILPLPVADTSGVVHTDPIGVNCDFTWMRSAHSGLNLDCSGAGLGQLSLVVESDGSLLLNNLGAGWRFIPRGVR